MANEYDETIPSNKLLYIHIENEKKLVTDNIILKQNNRYFAITYKILYSTLVVMKYWKTKKSKYFINIGLPWDWSWW